MEEEESPWSLRILCIQDGQSVQSIVPDISDGKAQAQVWLGCRRKKEGRRTSHVFLTKENAKVDKNGVETMTLPAGPFKFCFLLYRGHWLLRTRRAERRDRIEQICVQPWTEKQVSSSDSGSETSRVANVQTPRLFVIHPNWDIF